MSNPCLTLAASSENSDHPPCTDHMIPKGNEKVYLAVEAYYQWISVLYGVLEMQPQIPRVGMETISPHQDPALKDDGIKFFGKKYAQTLPLLSRLKHRSALHLVDFPGLKEDNSGDEQSRHFALPVCVSEATNHAKFSEEILPAQNRSQHLRHSDLALSLGLSTKQSFDLSGFGSPFSTIDNKTGSLPFESLGVLPQHSQTQTPPLEEDNKTASKRLNATEALTAQLTIFYAGKVHIYNDVPQDKAKAIMFLAENATRGSSHAMENRFATQISPISSTFNALHCSSSTAPDTLPQTSHDAAMRSSVSVGNALSGLQPAGNISYTALPQHRKISLQRFLQKRTERARAASPYVVNEKVESASNVAGSRPSSPVVNAAGSSRAASPAAFLGGSPCRSSASETTTHAMRSVEDLQLH